MHTVCLALMHACSLSNMRTLNACPCRKRIPCCRLAGKGTLVVSDALNHSSIVAGVRGSGEQGLTHCSVQRQPGEQLQGGPLPK